MVQVELTTELLTPREAAKLLKMSKYSVYRWVKRGWLVGIVMPNKTIRIPLAEMERIRAGRTGK